jgi:HlyD family secretion protein
MTAYVSIPVAAVNDVVKIPNAALRYKPDLPADKVQELYDRYGIHLAQRSTPAPSASPSAQANGSKRNGASQPAASDSAVVWKLLPDKSLQPLQVRVGLTDHTYTALLGGDVNPGDELVTGATTAKAGASAPSLGGPRR